MYKPDRVHGGVKEQGLCFWAFNRSCSSLHKTNGSKKRDSWLLVMKPERKDKLCKEMAMRLSALSLHKTTDNIIFIPLPPCQSYFTPSAFLFHFLFLTTQTRPGLTRANPEPGLLTGSLPRSDLKTMPQIDKTFHALIQKYVLIPWFHNYKHNLEKVCAKLNSRKLFFS